MSRFDTVLDVLAWGFSGASLANRMRKKETGESFGDAIEAVLGRTRRELLKKPVKSIHLTAGNSVKKRVNFIKYRVLKDSEDPRVREIVSAILAKKCGDNWCVPEKDWQREIEAIFNEVRKRVRYTRDIRSKDTFVSAPRTLAQYHIGDCDDLTISLGALLHHAGYPLRIRVIQTTGNKTFNHVYLMIGTPPTGKIEKWIPADASINWAVGRQAPAQAVIKYRDFPVMKKDG